MPTFILMTKLGPESLGTVSKRRSAGRRWLTTVRETCPEVHWVGHYALLGRYDFMDIYEAPDVETAHKVSLISRMQGAAQAESIQALPYEQFIDLLAVVDERID